MAIDTYGLPFEQYEEFFDKNIRSAAKLYLKTCNILNVEGVGHVDFKTILDIYQETVYAANDDCRRYQKGNNPEALKDSDLYNISPTREEIMEEVQSVNAKVEALTDYISNLITVTNVKVEALTDYISNLITVTTAGLEGIATTLDEPVD